MRLETFFPYRLAVVAEAFSRQLVAVYGREHGFSREEWRLLFLLEEAGTLDSLQLSQRTSLDKVQVSRAATRLEEKGLIRRNADRENRRNVLVELTPEGLEMARESFLAQTDMEKRLLTMLSPEEKEQLRTLLKRILLDLEERGEV